MYYNQKIEFAFVVRDLTMFQLVSVRCFYFTISFFLFFFFSYCVGVTLALLRCCDLCFFYFSTLCLKIVVHVDNLLLQTLLDFFLTCVIFLAEARLSLSFVSINLNLNYQTKKLSLWYNHCFQKMLIFCCLIFYFFPCFGEC